MAIAKRPASRSRSGGWRRDPLRRSRSRRRSGTSGASASIATTEAVLARRSEARVSGASASIATTEAVLARRSNAKADSGRVDAQAFGRHGRAEPAKAGVNALMSRPPPSFSGEASKAWMPATSAGMTHRVSVSVSVIAAHVTRRLAPACFALLAACCVQAMAQAQVWPQRPVRVIVPFAAGGNIDVIARLTCQRMSEVFGQQFIVENRVGGNGTIAAETAAHALPDGYTLFWARPAVESIFPAIPKAAHAPAQGFQRGS